MRLHSSTPPGPFERRALGVDGEPQLVVLRLLIGFEVEGPLVPGEEVVDRLLDLDGDEAPEIVLGEEPRCPRGSK